MQVSTFSSVLINRLHYITLADLTYVLPINTLHAELEISWQKSQDKVSEEK